MTTLYWKFRCWLTRLHMSYAVHLLAEKMRAVQIAQDELNYYDAKMGKLIAHYRYCNARYAMTASPETLMEEIGK